MYNKCDLARELRDVHYIPVDQIAVYVCIAERQSNLDTSAVGDGTYYGLYQLSSVFWCGSYGAGGACGVPCSYFMDDDITDDLNCVQIVLEEHERLSGNGFNAWPSYKKCMTVVDSYLDECFNDNSIIPYQPVQRNEINYGFSRQSRIYGVGKVYERCELARELRNVHNVPMDQIATWVCIAKHESGYNTSAIGRLNYDGSEDHGLFQISDIYWCSPPGKGKGCGLTCAELEDNDISNDVQCMMRIHAEHQRLSGNGFSAWSVYKGRCEGISDIFVAGCFEDDENDVLPFTPRPGIVQPQFPPPRPSEKAVSTKQTGKIYERCELARELRYQHNFPMEEVATWVCIAKHESDFNTSAIGRLNSDGSEDHGLFQISDLFWCSPPGNGVGCGLTCSQLEDSDITDDVACMSMIYEEHQRLSGDGFTAWTVYNLYCREKSKKYIDGCFVDDADQQEVKTEAPLTQQYFEPQTIKRSYTETTRKTTKAVKVYTNQPKTTKYQPPTTRFSTIKITQKSTVKIVPKITEKTTIKPVKTTQKPQLKTQNVPVTQKSQAAKNNNGAYKPDKKPIATLNRNDGKYVQPTSKSDFSSSINKVQKTQAAFSLNSAQKSVTSRPIGGVETTTFNLYHFYLNNFKTSAPIFNKNPSSLQNLQNYQPVFSSNVKKLPAGANKPQDINSVPFNSKTVKKIVPTKSSSSKSTTYTTKSTLKTQKPTVKSSPQRISTKYSAQQTATYPTISSETERQFNQPSSRFSSEELSPQGFIQIQPNFPITNRPNSLINLTPHSFEYLKQLTTPKTPFNTFNRFNTFTTKKPTFGGSSKSVFNNFEEFFAQ